MLTLLPQHASIANESCLKPEAAHNLTSQEASLPDDPQYCLPLLLLVSLLQYAILLLLCDPSLVLSAARCMLNADIKQRVMMLGCIV